MLAQRLAPEWIFVVRLVAGRSFLGQYSVVCTHQSEELGKLSTASTSRLTLPLLLATLSVESLLATLRTYSCSLPVVLYGPTLNLKLLALWI